MFFGGITMMILTGLLIVTELLGYFSIKDEKEKIRFKAKYYPFFGLYVLTVAVIFQYFEFNSDEINPFDLAFIATSLAVDFARKMFLFNVFFAFLLFGLAFYNYIKLKKTKGDRI